ncbi:hypothetical protein SO802_010634 [Lithocarpus litseifolius]|uniref:peroxidase n=1 Tax=Lithocarpus litseifolius TaxID=425828 RepID=A0AAW2DF99_9ROSI
MESLEMSESAVGTSYLQELSSLISSGAGFDAHDCQSLLKGRGLLFADQKLIANEKTARLATVYALDDGLIFRMDFAWAMMKMSSLNLLTGSQSQVRRNCSLALLRSAIDLKRHYKKGDSKSKTLLKCFLASLFVISRLIAWLIHTPFCLLTIRSGMVIVSTSYFFTVRLMRKERKGTIAAELLSDHTLADYR